MNVSDRFYSLINYRAKTYGVSKTEFCDMLYESQLNLIKVKCEYIKLEKRFKQLRKKLASVLSEKGKKVWHPREIERKVLSVSEHSKLMEEGLKLIEEMNPQKAKELKEQLEELREKQKGEKHIAL
jgi:hypothetical protein